MIDALEHEMTEDRTLAGVAVSDHEPVSHSRRRLRVVRRVVEELPPQSGMG